MIQEFKDFVNRGNVVELAVGLVMGAAFGAVVKSFVADIVMPFVGLLLGGTDFANMFVVLKGDGPFETLAAAQEAGAVTLNYGNFINGVVVFIITAFAIFLVVKAYNKMKKKEEEAPAAPAEPPREEVLLSEIRDLLKK